jgi:hypothetical protein
VADHTLAQTDQQNAPDAASPSAQADATGSVDAVSGLQGRYFIESGLLALVILGFAAILVFIRLRHREKRTARLDDMVAIDPSAGVSVKKDPLRINPYASTDAPLAPDRGVQVRLKEASKS